MAKPTRTVEQIKQEICYLQIEQEFIKHEKKLDGHLRHWLCHSQLVKFGTAYLCALVKNIAITAVSADDRIEDVLLITNIIDNRRNEKDRYMAINYIIDVVSSKHPYGRDIRDRIKDCTAFTSYNIRA